MGNAHLWVGGEDHPDRLTRRLDPTNLNTYVQTLCPQREVQRQPPHNVFGGGCVRVVLQQPTHHSHRRAVLRREVQRQLAAHAAALLGAGLRARRP